MTDIPLNFNAVDVVPMQTAPAAPAEPTAAAAILDAPPPVIRPYHNRRSHEGGAACRAGDIKPDGTKGNGKNESAMPENPEHMSAAERLLDRKQRDLAAIEAATVRDLARMFTTEAMETLVEVMQNPRAASPARVSAAALVIERGAGKPQNFFSPLRENISAMSAADAFATILKAANAGEVSHEEVKVLTSLFEARSKGIEIEELAKRLADLESQLEMANATTGSARKSPTVN